MNNKFTNFIIFTAGAAVGSVVTWKLLKTKYERLAQEEIDSVKEVFSRRENTPTDEVESKDTNVQKEPKEENPEVASYKQTLNDLGYTDYSDMGKKDDIFTPSVKPYVISPDEFGCAEGYDMIDLTYYADGILADDADDIVEDVDGTVGRDSLEHFGVYEPDAVHVRNDVRKVEYEILRVHETYVDSVVRVTDQTEEQ